METEGSEASEQNNGDLLTSSEVELMETSEQMLVGFID